MLYTGQSQSARRFRSAPIIFAALTTAYFIATAALLTTPGGKLLSIFSMVAGVAPFSQLARAIFQLS